jgi:tetrapyrrole methylase family protein/MazG family protein
MADHSIRQLLQIMGRLRGPNGCPWDNRQNHESLRPYVIEEAYELVEAIDGGDNDDIKEELGDLLLQIVFHCQIAQEEERFTFDDVIQGISEKLLRRHPHVFGGQSAADEEEALQNWERIKAEKEGKRKSKRHRGTPILHRALRLQEMAVGFGFDWEEPGQLLDKLDEEIDEIRGALASGDRQELTEEVGDLLFMAVNLTRFLEIHPEEALELSIGKFGKRFKAMENRAHELNRSLEEMDIDEMEKLWEEAKEGERRENRTKE